MVPTLTSSVVEALTALRAAQESAIPFHLVLADVHMPGADGFMLADAIKSDPAIAGAIVVMLTSGGKLGDAARGRHLGIAAYLTKPIKRAEVRDAMLVELGAGTDDRDR